jgi:hypothetical protein
MKRIKKQRGAKNRSDKVDELRRNQQKAFRAKFGRDPRPDEPLFFDPNKDAPVAIDLEQVFADLADNMREAGISPELIYAYEKTGFILVEGREYTRAVTDEYQAAIEEYFKLKAAGKIL